MLELMQNEEVKMQDLYQQAGVACVAVTIIGSLLIGLGVVPSASQMEEVKAEAKANHTFVNEIKTEQAVMKRDIVYIRQGIDKLLKEKNP